MLVIADIQAVLIMRGIVYNMFALLRVEFRQVGMGVRATALEAGYVKTVPASDISGNVGKHSVFESQFDDIRHALTPIAQSDTGGPTGAFGYKLYYSEPAAQSWTPSSSFRNQMRQGDAVSVNQFGYDAPKFRIEGSSNSRMQVKFSTGYTVPTNSTIEVGDGGELVYDVTDSGSKPTPPSLIRVEKGGKLRIRRSDSLHGRCNVILDGGELSFRDDLISTADTWTTLNLLTFRDGAKACGAAIRFGYSGTARWRVAGNVPSICEAPILLVNLNSGEDICVLDVTGDEAPDFILKGGISSYSGNRSTLRKTGGGTLAHYGACNTGSKISIEDGTWLLTGNASASQDYTLAGGTLGAADGTANAVGVLHVEGDGRIKVGADATLAFADSSSAAWNSSGHILIEGDLANGAVRVGTSSSALTSLQLSRLRYDGKRVKIDENGYLREDANGFKVIIK